mmetsp:Transcript_27753/g.65403  ORF Transcript_27753/g.65403 Transcript_27753/m.65403 type:complete len:736 (-) Transcript_27753:619-2826(-)
MRGEQEPLLQPGRSGEGRARPRLTRRVCLDALGGVIMVAFVCSLLIWHMREEGTEKQLLKAWHEKKNMFLGNEESSDLVNSKVAPCDDFYQYACGAFLEQSLPPDHDEWLYAFDGAKARIADRMHEVLSSVDDDAGVLFRSCMDQKAIEAAGIVPMRPYMTLAARATTNASFVSAVAKLHSMNSKAFFEWSVGADADSATQVLYLEQGGLTLPHYRYYLPHSNSTYVASLKKLVQKVMGLLGFSARDAARAAKSVIEIETHLATFHLSSAQEETVNSLPPLSFHQVATGMSDAGGFDWFSFFKGIGIDPTLLSSQEKLVRVLDVAYFQKLAAFLAAKPPAYFRWYLTWKFQDALIGHLGHVFQTADLHFRHELYGIQKDPPRWKICLHTLNLFLPDTVGAVYRNILDKAARRLHPDEPGGVEARAKWLLSELKLQFTDIIAKSAWMSPSSRQVASTKLADMKMEVGGPDYIAPLDFQVETDGWFNNSVNIAHSLITHQVGKVGTVLARSDWGKELGPMSVNAFYNIHSNALFIPAAMLQRPFLSTEGFGHLSPEDFGSLGGLAGHEMSHGFDNVGRMFGPDNPHLPEMVIKSWWDPKTVAEYKRRANCVSGYYSTYHQDGKAVPGNKTLEEDLADMGGLHIAYSAMLAHRRRHGEPAGEFHSQDARKAFFTTWAQTWCHLATPLMRTNALLTNPHAPPSIRVNAALSQFTPFAEAFECKPQTPMHKNLGVECSIW